MLLVTCYVEVVFNLAANDHPNLANKSKVMITLEMERKKERKTPEANEKMKMSCLEVGFEPTTLCTLESTCNPIIKLTPLSCAWVGVSWSPSFRNSALYSNFLDDSNIISDLNNREECL